MTFREANAKDITEMSSVRMSVIENVLRTPELVTVESYIRYLEVDGKGWVCEVNKHVVGFAIVGLVQQNIWALFVRPEYEQKGIGKKLQTIMLDWYFTQTEEQVWLTTAPGTRAETFYLKSGWMLAGKVNIGEVKLLMTFDYWTKIRHRTH